MGSDPEAWWYRFGFIVGRLAVWAVAVVFAAFAWAVAVTATAHIWHSTLEDHYCEEASDAQL